MRPHDPLLHLILAILHLPQSSSLILPTPPSIEIRNPTFPEPTPAPSQQLTQNPSCALLSQALSICAVLTPGFLTLLPSLQAHCLCYSSAAWAPKIFDDAVKTCADFASTAAAGAFLPLLNLEGFCFDMGDVDKDAPASVQVTPTGQITSAGMGGTPVNIPPSLPTYGAGNGSGSNGGQGSPVNGSGNNGSSSEGGNGSSSPGSTRQSGGSSVSELAPMTPTVTSRSIGLSPLMPTTTLSGVTITVIGGEAGTTKTADGAVRNRGEVTDTEVVLVSLAISALILFL